MTAARSAVNMVSAFRSILAWSLLGVIMGFALFSLVLLSLVGARLRGRAARTVIERAASLYLWCSPLYRISVRGREHLPASGSYVLVANHESGLDGACLMVLAPRGRFLATSWLFRTPIIGFVMRSCEHIPERRHTAPEGPVEAMSMALRAGTNVVVFPEGEYGCSAVAPLRLGAFVAARQAGVPIVPVRLRGTGAAWRPGTLFVQGRNDVDVEVLEPLSADTVVETDLGELQVRVRDQLEAAK